MKNKLQLIAALSIPFLIACTSGLSCNAQDLPEKSYLVLTPKISSAPSHVEYGAIPFAVQNTYTKDILVYFDLTLMTINGSGAEVSIDGFRRGVEMPGRTPTPPPVTLKPGETGTFAGSYSLETLSFLLKRNKEMFGRINACIAGTNQGFESHSDPFPVPADLATPPWVEMGEQRYFSIVPDLTKSKIDELVIAGGSILFPVKITNTSTQPCIAATDSVSFYIARDISKRNPPSPWDTVSTSAPILKPSESAISTGRCYIQFNSLKSQGYKPGDNLVAAVGGRIPNTNRIFECYSAPFELPPLPAGSQPK